MKEGLETAPVCRMTIRKEDAVPAEGDGVMYYFCSEVCQDKLLEDLPCARISYDLPRPPWRPAVPVELEENGLSCILRGTPPTRASGSEPSKVMEVDAGNLAASTIVSAP